jgi:hypothetical protein
MSSSAGQMFFFKNSVVNAGIKLYNRLPNEIGKDSAIQEETEILSITSCILLGS